MDEHNRVLITLNQTGIDIAEDEIDSVLNLDDKLYELKREYLANHFNVERDKLSRQMLERYAEADKVMKRISAGSAHDDIRERLVDTLLSTKKCYSHAEYRACIELCALYAEMLANYLCIADKDKLISIVSDLETSDRKEINRKGVSDMYFTDKYNQRFRLMWLVKAGVLESDDKETLIYIHDLRIKYFHHWGTDPKNAKYEALDALAKLSSVAAKYLEILGDEPRTCNQGNVDRIKRYMKAVSDNK